MSKILGSIIRIPIQNIAGDTVFGIFSYVYPVYMVALILSVAGLPLAISKLIAEAKQNKQSIRDIYITASLLAILFGIISFTIIFSFSETITNILWGGATRLALIVVAGTLLVAPYMAVYRGYFQGMGNMKPTAISQVIEQLIRVVTISVIAFYLVEQGYSDEIIAGGVMAGSIIGALASLLYLRIKYQREHIEIPKGHRYSLPVFKKWGKIILLISAPIAIGSLTMALFNMVDSVTVSYGLRATGLSTDETHYLFGIYSRGLTIMQIATVFATSIVLPLVPLITQKLNNRENGDIKAIVEKTYQLTHLISWPAAVGLFVLTVPLNIGIFTNMEGNTVLAIINASSVFTSFALISTGILQGMNLSRVAALVILGGVGLKTIANLLFVQSLGLEGVAWITLLVYIVISVINTIIIYKYIPFRLIDKNITKILFASIIMGIVIKTPLMFFDLGDMTRLMAMGYLFLAIIVGALVYGVLLILLKENSLAELLKGEYIKKKR